MRFIVPALALLLCACGGGKTLDQLETERRQGIADIASGILTPAREFDAEKPTNCSSAKLKKAIALARLTMSEISPSTHGLDTARTVAEAALEVGDIAKRHGCKEAARETYDAIMKVYVGTAYAAYRERAVVGINDLR